MYRFLSASLPKPGNGSSASAPSGTSTSAPGCAPTDDEALDRKFGPAPTDANELVAPVKAAPSHPTDLEGLTIAVGTRSGDFRNATVTEVVERSSDPILVRHSGRTQ